MATDMVAYGIYPDSRSFEHALEALRAAGFRNSDVSAILPDRDGTEKISRMRSIRRPLKVSQQAPALARQSAVCWVGSSASERSRFRGLDRW